MAENNVYSCFLCGELRPNQVLLQCFHVFCPECLTNAKDSNLSPKGIVCPCCKQISPFSNTSWVKNLQFSSHQSRSQLKDAPHQSSDSPCKSSLISDQSPDRLTVAIRSPRYKSICSAPDVSTKSGFRSASVTVPKHTPSDNSLHNTFTNNPNRRSLSCESGRQPLRCNFRRTSETSKSCERTKPLDRSASMDDPTQQHSQSQLSDKCLPHDSTRQGHLSSAQSDHHSIPHDSSQKHSQSYVSSVQSDHHSLPHDSSQKHPQRYVPSVQSDHHSLPHDSSQKHSQSYVSSVQSDHHSLPHDSSQKHFQSYVYSAQSDHHSLPHDSSQKHSQSYVSSAQSDHHSLPHDSKNLPSQQCSQSGVPDVRIDLESLPLDSVSDQHSQPNDESPGHKICCTYINNPNQQCSQGSGWSFDNHSSNNISTRHFSHSCLQSYDHLISEKFPTKQRSQSFEPSDQSYDHQESRNFQCTQSCVSSGQSCHHESKNLPSQQHPQSCERSGQSCDLHKSGKFQCSRSCVSSESKKFSAQRRSRSYDLDDQLHECKNFQHSQSCVPSGQSYNPKNFPTRLRSQSCSNPTLSKVSKHVPIVLCSEHKGKEMELYCKTCDQPICLKCAVKGGKHFKHDYEEISQASLRFKREIMRKSLHPVETRLTSTTDFLDKIDAIYKDISERQDAIKEDIRDTFATHQAILEARRDELIAQLNEIALGKLRVLALQREKITSAQALLDDSLGDMRKSLSGSSKQVLMTMLSDDNFFSVPLPDMLKPGTESDMVFKSPRNFASQCMLFGSVLALNSPCPSKCFVISKSLVSVVSSPQNGTVTLQVNDFDGKPFRNTVNSVKGILVSEIADVVTSCDVVKSWKQGQYKLSYLLYMKGKHQLHVKVEGHHVKDSPFTITVQSSMKEFSTPILIINDLTSPRGIAISHKGEIIVVEEGANRVSIFTPNGKKIRSFGLPGSKKGEFQSPRGVTVDDQGDILVADSENHRIQKFTPKGHFITASSIIASSAFGLPKSSYPTGIAFNPVNRKLYMVDIDHCVHVLHPDFSAFNRFGSKGIEKGQLHSPWNIVCDKSGSVYVTDTGNHRVQVFTAQGKFLRKFGSQGAGKGELNWPDGIAVHDGTVIVSEYRNNRVSVFTSEGQFVTSFGSSGSNLGEFLEPFGVAVDSSGLVYVCDCGNNRVQVF